MNTHLAVRSPGTNPREGSYWSRADAPSAATQAEGERAYPPMSHWGGRRFRAVSVRIKPYPVADLSGAGTGFDHGVGDCGAGGH